MLLTASEKYTQETSRELSKMQTVSGMNFPFFFFSPPSSFFHNLSNSDPISLTQQADQPTTAHVLVYSSFEKKIGLAGSPPSIPDLLVLKKPEDILKWQKNDDNCWVFIPYHSNLSGCVLYRVEKSPIAQGTWNYVYWEVKNLWEEEEGGGSTMKADEIKMIFCHKKLLRVTRKREERCHRIFILPLLENWISKN